MLRLKFTVCAAILWFSTAGAVLAQPALTTVRDVLYKADGTRFNGTVAIDWNSFQAGDGSSVATEQVNALVVNGVLEVRLVPTTDASAGANYSVTYNSSGRFQFTETWAVPPSSTPLRVRDVRIAEGTIVGPSPVTSPILITDVTGLLSELSLLVPQGTGYLSSRAAVINSSAQLDAANGSPADCLHVDGSSGPCGSASGNSPGFVDGETPGGLLNGANPAFTLANAPSPAASLALYWNGVLMKQGLDYSLSGAAVTFLTPSLPRSADTLVASYRLNGSSGNSSIFASPQVLCSATGIGTSATALTSLGTCTIPAGLLGVGDRIDIRFNFTHDGSAAGFTTQVAWGSTSLVSRTGAASEAVVTGKADAATNSAGTQLSVESWGQTLPFAASVGSATDSISSAITINFLGQMGAVTTDTVTLRNFTVMRYPAVTHP
ncbi:MAG: hypothetical protein ABI165_05820 [Bryobacteraceae bacterium]